MPPICHSHPHDDSSESQSSSLDAITHEEYKSLCWYSEQELSPSREDARQAMHALQKVNGDVDAVDCPHMCLRGLEKYADPMQKVTGQRKLVESVLQQQNYNRSNSHDGGFGDEHIANVSRYLSQPFKDLARYYAVMHHEEYDDDEDFLEDEEEQSGTFHTATATVSEEEEENIKDDDSNSTWIHVAVINSTKLDTMNPSPSLDQSINKRPRSACFDESSLHLRRSVKQCVQVSE